MKRILYNNYIELVAIIISLVNIFTNVIPVVPLIFGVIIFSLIRLDLIGAFLVSAFSISPILGFVLYYLGLPSYGFLIEAVLLIACIFQWSVNNKIKLNNFSIVFLYFVLVLVVFIISSLITTGGDYAVTKLLSTAKTGIIYLFAFGFLFSNFQKCNFIRIGLYLILYSILMLLLSTLLNNGSGPENILDFGYMRTQSYVSVDEDEMLVSYHYVGFLAVIGCSIMLFESFKTKLNNGFIFICLIISILVSLYAGARQFVIISLAIFMLFYFSRVAKGSLGILLVAIGIILGVVFVSFLFEEGGMLNSVKEEGYMDASSRGVYLLKAFNDFIENPILGVGFGRFEIFGLYGAYPHNMIVEILCEMGIVGFLLLALLLFKPLKILIVKQRPCVYLLIIFFFRSMVSGGLDNNIMLFSYVFAVMCLKNLKSNTILKQVERVV